MIAIVEALHAGLLNRKNILRNVLAGLVVAFMALPMSMAFAIASGAKPEAGIYTSIVAVIVVSLFGGSRVQITGPTSAFIGLLISIVSAHGIGGLQIAVIMAGIFMVLLGLLKCGKMIKFIPEQVIAGFTAGIGINMIIGQLPNFFGISPESLKSALSFKAADLANIFSSINARTLCLGIATIMLVLVIDNTKLKKIPSPLWVIAFGIAVQMIFNFYDIETGIETIGSKFGGLPRSLPKFTPTGKLSFELIESLLGPSFAIAMLGAIESLLCAVITDSLTGIKHDSNQELIAHGLANITSPLFGGIATTGSIARTIASIRAGANSPLAGISSAIILAIVVYFLAPLVNYAPLVSLTVILFFVGYRMINVPHCIKLIIHAPKSDSAIFILTLFLTLSCGIVTAVETGVILSALILMYRMSDSWHIDRAKKSKGTSFDFSELPEGVAVYTLSGPLFFGIIDKMSKMFSSIEMGDRIIILGMHDVPFIDATGIQNLNSAITTLKKSGKSILLCDANDSVVQKLHRSDLISDFIVNAAGKPMKDVIELADTIIKQLNDNSDQSNNSNQNNTYYQNEPNKQNPQIS